MSKTDGVSPAFIRELLRKASFVAAEGDSFDGERIRDTDAHLETALRVARVCVSACAGIAERAAGSPASATLIADADAALYQAKSSGPGRWAVCGAARGVGQWQAS